MFIQKFVTEIYIGLHVIHQNKCKSIYDTFMCGVAPNEIDTGKIDVESQLKINYVNHIM